MITQRAAEEMPTVPAISPSKACCVLIPKINSAKGFFTNRGPDLRNQQHKGEYHWLLDALRSDEDRLILDNRHCPEGSLHSS
jgi:hypothetical protein